MDTLTSKKLLEYALANPFDGTQDIKPYQYQEDQLTITLYVNPADEGYLSLTARQMPGQTELGRILSVLSLPNCRLVGQEERKGYVINRYRFDPPDGLDVVTAVATTIPSSSNDEQEQPSWRTIEDNRCHICHRELTDPLSLKVKIGSVCRQKIEKAEEENSDMWNNMTQERLEALWTTYNIYDQRRREQPRPKPAAPPPARFISPPITDSPPSFRLTKPPPKPEALSPSAPGVGLPEAPCMICGQLTTDYWYYDGKTQKCKCRSCLRQKKT